MGFFLIIPVRILLHPGFFVMLTLVITDIPELGCCIAHMPDEVRIFPADLYGCFLWQQHFLSSIVSVSFALMFDIPADIFFRYRPDHFHIIGMVPQLPFPKLVSYFRKTFEKFPAGYPLQVFHDRSYGQFRRGWHKTVYMVSFPTFKQMDRKALILCDLLHQFLQICLDLRI